MNLKDMMQYNNFVVVGDTLNSDKYAYKIKHALLNNGYVVESVGKELNTINDVTMNIDIIDLCIHPAKGIKLLQNNNKSFKGIIIQPGAESKEILDYLNDNHYTYIEGCVLVGLSLYKKNSE